MANSKVSCGFAIAQIYLSSQEQPQAYTSYQEFRKTLEEADCPLLNVTPSLLNLLEGEATDRLPSFVLYRQREQITIDT